MTKILDQAIKAAHELSEGEQDAAGLALLDHIEAMRDLQLTDEQLAEVRRRRAAPHREFLTLVEVRSRLRRLGV